MIARGIIFSYNPVTQYGRMRPDDRGVDAVWFYGKYATRLVAEDYRPVWEATSHFVQPSFPLYEGMQVVYESSSVVVKPRDLVWAPLSWFVNVEYAIMQDVVPERAWPAWAALREMWYQAPRYMRGCPEDQFRDQLSAVLSELIQRGAPYQYLEEFLSTSLPHQPFDPMPIYAEVPVSQLGLVCAAEGCGQPATLARMSSRKPYGDVLLCEEHRGPNDGLSGPTTKYWFGSGSSTRPVTRT